MKLRTKLILAFLVMSVLPLTGIVLYSYFSSIQTLRMAALAEVAELTGEIGERIETIRNDVGRGVQQLGTSQFGDLLAEAEGTGDSARFLTEVDLALGEAAPFVESLEFVPVPPPAPDRLVAAETPDSAAGDEPDAWSGIASVVIHLGELSSRLEQAGEGSREWLASAEAEQLVAELEAQAELAGAEIAADAVELDIEQLRRDAERLARAAEHLQHERATRELAEEHRRVLKMEPKQSENARLVWESELLETEELEQRKLQELEAKRLLGREFDWSVEERGKEVGRLKAQISAKKLLKEVLHQADRAQGEIPFAVDTNGEVYVAREGDLEALAGLPLTAAQMEAIDEPRHDVDDWIIVRLEDEKSGMIYGIARPIGQSLADLRKTAGRNFAYGVALIGMALVGIAPLSRRITRDLQTLTEGAEQLAAGHLDARVPVRSRDEVGHLAQTFNQMAEDLQLNQHQLLEQERRTKEHEIARRLLEAENSRRGEELEAARRFQLSLLPKRLPEHPELAIGVFMKTATEVGGDYYDFHLSPAGVLTLAVGDATGHGASAGTMVTVIKSLFVSDAADCELPEFLERAARSIRRMELGRMAMALTLARYRQGRLTISAAGMPPVLLRRATSGRVEELAVEGVPLGAMSDYAYRQRSVDLAPGDICLLMSDGFPELTNDEGEPLGYAKVREVFGQAAAGEPEELIARLAATAEAFSPGSTPSDDITFVALQVKV